MLMGIFMHYLGFLYLVSISGLSLGTYSSWLFTTGMNDMVFNEQTIDAKQKEAIYLLKSMKVIAWFFLFTLPFIFYALWKSNKRYIEKDTPNY